MGNKLCCNDLKEQEQNPFEPIKALKADESTLSSPKKVKFIIRNPVSYSSNQQD
jgi:hypothetical protein